MKVLRKEIYLIIFLVGLCGFAYPQQNTAEKNQNQEKLIQFAKQKSAEWKIEKKKADSLAAVLDFPIFYFENNNSKVVILQRLGAKNRPVYYATDNISAAATISVDELWENDNEFPALNGEGVNINIWDGGSIRTTHKELQGEDGARVVMRDLELPVSDHSTHIAGTMIATGVKEEARGMASKALIKAWDLNDDLAEMAGAAADGIVLSNHSYGPFCGWYYNSNTESWYWYGDPEISENEDYEFGFYNNVSAGLDRIAELAPNYLIVKSAGNDRDDGPTSSFEHYVWDDSWILVDQEREPDGGDDGYDCLTSMSVAKNILTVGAVDDGRSMTPFSAFGPTDDGRIKPDVVANGYNVYSSTSSTDNSYDTYSGTSMSTASATGAISLLNQLQNVLQPGIKLRSSTLKGLLIHTASDLGNSGPDYRFGWGVLNVKKAADLMYANSNNQGKNIIETVLSQGEEIIIPVSTSSSYPFLKVTLSWTDPPGQPSLPSLNSRDTKLVNDLDVSVQNNNSLQTFLPWVLNVVNPAQSATHGVNHIDNVEQVYIANPGDNNFNIKISHSGSLDDGNQAFSLIISGIETTPNIFPPQNLTYTISESGINLSWGSPEAGTPAFYRIYRNGTVLAETSNLYYNDESIILDNVYNYYITAIYVINDEEVESLETNQVTVYPQTLRTLPFTVDFESEPAEVQMKDNEMGWRWGDSESLNSYYLNFSENGTNFIGIDSYSAGDAVHVSDIAITPPLRLGNYNNVVLSFDYLLKTGIYDAIDELHVVYKLQYENGWNELENLSSSFNWVHERIEFPSEICIDGIQIGFYYDDFYQWGMGAGLDNIEVVGELDESVDLNIHSLEAPVSSCVLTSNENVILEIENVGALAAPPETTINIHVTLSDGADFTESFILEDNLFPNGIVTYQMNQNVDLSEAGSYVFEIEISCILDGNESNNTLVKTVDVYGLPQLAILNTDTVFCKNDQQILVEVSPLGGTLSGTGISGMYFDPDVAGFGTHTITYSMTDENGCHGETSRNFVVVATPEPSILNEDVTFCVNDEKILVEVSPIGGILSGAGISDDYFDPALAGVGAHTISYSITEGEGCDGEVSIDFVVTEALEPTILNEDLMFCEDEQEVLVEVSPSGGILNGTGISGDYFDPSVAGIGIHTLSYLVVDENGCQGEVLKDFIVNARPEPSILNEDLIFYESDQPVLVEVSPSGGVLSGTGISGDYFDPSVAGIGIHTITYSVTDIDGCQGEVSKDFGVYAFSEPEILNEDLTFCEDDQEVLIEVSPVGGILTGTGITGEYFNPSLAGVGTHIISYSVVDKNDNELMVSREVIVNSIPIVSIINSEFEICEGEDPIKIEVSPTGGTLTGAGIQGSYFYPDMAGPGNHEIVYEYINTGSCIGTAFGSFEVHENPLVDLGPDQVVDVDDNILLTVSGDGCSFVWFDESTENELSIEAQEIGIGTHDIWVCAMSENNCSSIDSMILTVDISDYIDVDNSCDLIVYPNPFSEGIYLNLNENEVITDIQLFDIDGKGYSVHQTTDRRYFNLSHLPEGIYILKMTTNLKVYEFKIVKI
ncbi:S8 family serine peptidase [Sunxiuqinia sp. A32]|uniref:S8 family serine peptidase n=1 Tax=Sunxiuqinia sp. A32 TaxID=3461496 RepID=UPI0040461C1F